MRLIVDELLGRISGGERVLDLGCGSGEIDGTFDAVLANIGRAAVVALASDLVQRLSPGGWLAVSGISPSQCSLVTGFLSPLMEIERRTAGEWSVVVLERAPDATNAPNLRTGALSDPSP